MDSTGNVQGGNRLILNRCHQGKLFGVVHLEIVGIQVGLDPGRRRGLGLRVRLGFTATI